MLAVWQSCPAIDFPEAVSISSTGSSSVSTVESYPGAVSQSETTNLGATRICSIADALDIVGGRWSLLFLRELSFGVHRFTDIQINTGAPRRMLALRLHTLEEAGVIERRRYCDHPRVTNTCSRRPGRGFSRFCRHCGSGVSAILHPTVRYTPALTTTALEWRGVAQPSVIRPVLRQVGSAGG